MSVSRHSLALLSLAVGCGQGAVPTPVEATHAHFGAGTVARVGAVEITSALVADVARAQRTEPRAALGRLIDDALAAQGARAAGEDRDPGTVWALESALARSTAEHVKLAVRAGGPPTDSEVADLTARYWRDVDLPEQVKVIHALVLRPKDASQIDAARAFALELATAVSGAKSDDDFEARAKALPAAPFTVRIERLPAFVADGRTAESDPNLFDPAFTRAAFSLRKPGDTSGTIESPFGWHVIRLIERRPPRVVPLEERRQRFAGEVYARRGRDALTGIIAARSAGASTEILPGADARMEAAASGTSP